MKKISLLAIICIGYHLRAQNSFPGTGPVLIGTTTSNGYPLQVIGKSWNGNTTNTGGLILNPVLSRANDVIRLGNLINTGDGQNSVLATSNNSGSTFTNVIVERDGYIGLGTSSTSPAGWNVANPAIGINANGTIEIRSNNFSFGVAPKGPNNCSSLIMTVSNTNEWLTGTSYPNGANYYVFETFLGSALNASRALLKIGGRELHFMTGSSDVEAAMISSTGSFGIGTTNINDVNYKLFVETGIRTRKIKVDQSTWPDYVFKHGYTQLSIDDLAKYIGVHNHLPEVPTAREVQANGIDLGENQAVLLKKIEELTLYIIKDHKLIEQLQKEIIELKENKSGQH